MIALQRTWLVALAVAAIPLMAGCDMEASERQPAATSSAESQDPHAGEAEAHEEDGGEDEAHADEVGLTDEAIAQHGVKVAAVERRSIATAIVAPARVAFNAERMAHVGSLVQGRVSEIRVRLGDRVRAGDVLLIIDSPELGALQSEFLTQRTVAEAARPAVTLAQDAYDRARQLYEEAEGISLAEVQRRQAEFAAARREQAAADAALAAAENALRLHGCSESEIGRLAGEQQINSRFEVRAPIEGEVVDREATPGELVSPDDESLLVIADLGTVWVVADVSEPKLTSVGVGSAASIELPAIPDQTFDGTVTYVSPVVNELTRTARLRVEVPNPGGLLRPGMFARALLSPADGEGEATLALPAAAVMTIEGEASVFVPVEGEPNTFARRVVAIGPRAGGFVPILSGLVEGERVVVAGTFILKAELGKAGAAHDH